MIKCLKLLLVLRIIFQRDGKSLRKSIFFNLRYLPFRQAIHLPVLLSPDVQVRDCHKGCIQFMGGVRYGLVQIGYVDNKVNYDHRCSLSIKGTIVVRGDGFHLFGAGLKLSVKENAIFEIGNNFGVSVDARINVAKKVVIGDDNMWSYDIVIMDTDSHQICNAEGAIINNNQMVTIGNHVWLACRCIVLKGAEILDGTVVAAGSVITKSTSQCNCIISNNGRIIKDNIYWNRNSVIG